MNNFQQLKSDLYMIGGYVMAILFALLLSGFLSGCASNVAGASVGRSEYKRVTFYHRFEDKFGSHTASGFRASEGRTVAASPRFPLGSPLFIPSLCGIVGNGNFTVQDRGRIVRLKDRIDVYVEARSKREGNKRLKLLGSLPQPMEVYY